MKKERRASPAGGSPVAFRTGGIASGWVRALLLAAIVVLLAALVLIPPWIGRHTDALHHRLGERVFPAQEALQQSRSALSEALAAVRGYQLSGDTLFLARLQDALAREGAAAERLGALTDQLGEESHAAVEEYRSRAGLWQEAPRALLTGEATRAGIVTALPEEQRRFEIALAAAAAAGAALNDAQMDLERRIQSASQRERLLVVLLSLVTLSLALVAGRLAYSLHRLSRRIERRAERLLESEERFRLIAENLREMIWISDPAYTVQYYLSPAYEQIWGRSIERARTNPRSFLDAVLPQDRERVEAALEGYARGEYHAEYRIERPDGEIRWISGRAYPVLDEHGQVFRVAGIAEDITEEKQVEAEREGLLESERNARAETEAALRVRDQVLRIVSHDLKNPLHTIGMAAELLEMPLEDEQKGKQLAIIRRTVDRANRMVLDLLDAARIQSGRAIAVEPQPAAVRPLLGELVEAFRLQAEEKNQRLTCDVADGTAPVLADHDRILQALANLLGNAVKFTPEGGQVSVRAEPDGGEGVAFLVSDTGPGIPEETLPHLFEPFAQAKNTASLGTGLGLAIARGIVEAHGSQLQVQSEPGKGTTFRFTLRTAGGDTG